MAKTDYGLVREIISGHEGFTNDPYWDVNAWRAGYGSDTYTDSAGVPHKVEKGVAVADADADRDIERRMREFEKGVIKKVGGEAWERLSKQAKASVLSVAYNYGSLSKLPSLVKAIQSGDESAIADQIEARGVDNGGINAERRAEEAQLIRDNPQLSPVQMLGQLAGDALGIPRDIQGNVNALVDGSSPVLFPGLDMAIKGIMNRDEFGVPAQTAVASLLDVVQPSESQTTAGSAPVAAESSGGDLSAPEPADIYDRITARNNAGIKGIDPNAPAPAVQSQELGVSRILMPAVRPISSQEQGELQESAVADALPPPPRPRPNQEAGSTSGEGSQSQGISYKDLLIPDINNMIAQTVSNTHNDLLLAGREANRMAAADLAMLDLADKGIANVPSLTARNTLTNPIATSSIVGDLFRDKVTKQVGLGGGTGVLSLNGTKDTQGGPGKDKPGSSVRTESGSSSGGIGGNKDSVGNSGGSIGGGVKSPQSGGSSASPGGVKDSPGKGAGGSSGGVPGKDVQSGSGGSKPGGVKDSPSKPKPNIQGVRGQQQ